MKEIKLIIYDFDGTLVSSTYQQAVNTADVVTKHAQGMKELPTKEQLTKFFDRYDITGLNTAGKLEALKNEYKIDLTNSHTPIQSELRSLKRQIYKSPKTVVHVDALRFIRKMKAANMPQAIASTNDQKTLEEAVEGFNLRKYFMNAVHAPREGEKPKPAPDMLLRIAREYGVHPAECIYIGDATSDMKAARWAGMTAIAYYPLEKITKEGVQAFIEAGANHFVHTMDEVEHIVNQSRQPQPATVNRQ